MSRLIVLSDRDLSILRLLAHLVAQHVPLNLSVLYKDQPYANTFIQ